MQVFKKFSILFLGLILAGCSFGPSTKSGFDGMNSEISEENFGSPTNFRVGVLLPAGAALVKNARSARP